MNNAQLEANNANTLYTDWKRFYKLSIRTEKDDSIKDFIVFSFYKQLWPNQHWYYFEISENEYKEAREKQRKQLHKKTLEKVYDIYWNNNLEEEPQREEIQQMQLEEQLKQENTKQEEIQQEIDIDLDYKDRMYQNILDDIV